jgi:muramoyltetrapeptide carboxypeptidase
MNIIKPKKLNPGEKIGVISPASRPSDEQKLSTGIGYLEKKGFELVSGTHVLNNHGYLAGNDDERVDDLNRMFADPEIRAIICSRGGYGVPRILNKVDYDSIKENPKILVGYSDITALNLAVFAQTGLVTFFGPMVAVEFSAGIHEYTERKFFEIVTNSQDNKILQNPVDDKLHIIKTGKAEGILIPGCLSVLHGVIGTPFMPDMSNAILVLEDIDEEPYRLDRYFASLRLSGILDTISGLIIGQLIDCESSDPTKPSLTIEEVIQDYVGDLKIPVVTNFAYGHGPVKMTLPMGVKAKIDTSVNEISLIESAVVD